MELIKQKSSVDCFKCPVCYFGFGSSSTCLPIILECGHTICYKCIQVLLFGIDASNNYTDMNLNKKTVNKYIDDLIQSNQLSLSF
jgi:hypothetical protein